jgi:hypothetical protein
MDLCAWREVAHNSISNLATKGVGQDEDPICWRAFEGVTIFDWEREAREVLALEIGVVINETAMIHR